MQGKLMRFLFTFCLALTTSGFLCLLYISSSERHRRPAAPDKGIPGKCWSMFNIGVQKYPKRNFGNGLAPGTSYYEEVSESLPTLLRTLPNGTLDLLPKSRLQITGGRLDYLDCGIRMYDAKDVMKCSALRRNGRDGPLWIAFVGDSKMRDTFKGFLNMTPNFNWHIYNTSSKEVTSTTWETFASTHHPKFQQSVSVKGALDSRVDLVWATHGLNIYKIAKVPQEELEYWAYEASQVPDVVVIGFGAWSITGGFASDHESLNPFTDCVDEWMKASKVLEILSRRTPVIAWAQSRSREFTAKRYAVNGWSGSNTDDESLNNETANDRFYRVSYYTRHLSTGAEWADEAMHVALLNSNIIIWDSMLPSGLLNIKECQSLYDAGMMEHPTYFAHACHDDIHPDQFTIRDEHTMILNLLCNHHMDNNGSRYCCP
ncbi:uncharacterized protein LOC135226749 [Macrobrachium nipponense]|uniref:uncharacterized protein LOC135226749 n=1 Tax=Macrobrachium nipponense TaxID=159736 RepID=UPI0030C7E288